MLICVTNFVVFPLQDLCHAALTRGGRVLNEGDQRVGLDTSQSVYAMADSVALCSSSVNVG
jgi:hypothetical protein